MSSTVAKDSAGWLFGGWPVGRRVETITVLDSDSEDHIDLWSYPKGVQRLAEAEAFTERQMYSRVERVTTWHRNLLITQHRSERKAA